MFREPGTLDKAAEVGDGVEVVLAETFPAVFCEVEAEELFLLAYAQKAMVAVKLDSAYRIDVRRTPEHVGASVGSGS